MSTTGRMGKINEEQKSALIAYLSSNEQLKSGKFTASFTFKKAQQCWMEIGAILNGIPGGANKDWRQWRKTWHDLRTKAKSKNAAIKKHRDGTGGGAPLREVLTPSEQQIIELICPTSSEGHLDIFESAILYNDEMNEISNMDITAGPSSIDIDITAGPTSTDVIEVSSVSDRENVPPSLQATPKNMQRRHKNLTQSVEATKHLVDIGKEGNEMRNWYFQEKIQLKERELAIREREVAVRERELAIREQEVAAHVRGIAVFERIAATVERIATTVERIARSERM